MLDWSHLCGLAYGLSVCAGEITGHKKTKLYKPLNRLSLTQFNSQGTISRLCAAVGSEYEIAIFPFVSISKPSHSSLSPTWKYKCWDQMTDGWKLNVPPLHRPKKRNPKKTTHPLQILKHYVRYWRLWIIMWFGIFGLCSSITWWSRRMSGFVYYLKCSIHLDGISKSIDPSLNPFQQYYIISLYISWSSLNGQTIYLG